MNNSTLLLLILLLAACAAPGSGTSDPSHEDAGERATGPQQDDDSTPHDRRIQARLARALGSLQAAGRTVPVGELREQLERRTTRLELPAADGGPIEPTALYERARRSVVVFGKRYRCNKCEKWHLSCATGVALTADGVVATAHHVLENEDDGAVFAVMTEDGVVRPMVEILASDSRSDVALVRVEGPPMEALPLRTDIAVGSPVWVLSHPARTFWYMSQGQVGRRFLRGMRDGEPVELLDITADFARGSSGGPVLDASGAVVGLVRATRSIYYKEEDGVQRDLQMVLKHCAPASALRALLATED